MALSKTTPLSPSPPIATKHNWITRETPLKRSGIYPRTIVTVLRMLSFIRCLPTSFQIFPLSPLIMSISHYRSPASIREAAYVNHGYSSAVAHKGRAGASTNVSRNQNSFAKRQEQNIYGSKLFLCRNAKLAMRTSDKKGAQQSLTATTCITAIAKACSQATKIAAPISVRAR